VEVTYAGRPLPNAQVKFVPEAFLGDVIPPATATTDVDGRASMASEGQPEFVRVGMYRVEITSDQAKLPASFNSRTTLGVEVSPYTDPKLQAGVARFNLRR
jgi:hypothetical protein